MSFSISIIRNPVFIWDERRKCQVINWDKNQGDYNLDFILDDQDFVELGNLLNIKLPAIERLKGESYDDHNERIKNKYFEFAKEKGYEMLGRIWDWYESVVYLPSEINQLLDECQKITEKTHNPNQVAALDKLIIACNKALKVNSGIFLGSD